MVAVIKTGSSIRRIFLYNENKVMRGVAECLAAINYPMDAQEMTAAMRLNRLLQQTALNSKVTRNSVHISLNFDPSDKDLSPERLVEIAKVYMAGIGFAAQPFLIYQHHDAAHPHIHLLSTKVRSDGSRIDMHNIGRHQSEKIRQFIELNFHLIKAEDSKLKTTHRPKSIDVTKVHYGTSQTKASIQNVLEAVLDTYNFSSLFQLNAILRQYHIIADRGSENSRSYRHQGLSFRLLDDQGIPVGVPIKASAFYNNPTLVNLKRRFKRNEASRKQLKIKSIHAISQVMQGNIRSLAGLNSKLLQQGIQLLIRQNTNGDIYGLTYIDHKNRCVFNGSELGKSYSAKAILAKFMLHTEQPLRFKQLPHRNEKLVQPTLRPSEVNAFDRNYQLLLGNVTDMLNDLWYSSLPNEYLPYPWRASKKKRKKSLRQ